VLKKAVEFIKRDLFDGINIIDTFKKKIERDDSRTLAAGVPNIPGTE
jgi:hypothetical protein